MLTPSFSALAGCAGKTEIARRLALVTDSPFIKVEATKFTEVGFYGVSGRTCMHCAQLDVDA